MNKARSSGWQWPVNAYRRVRFRVVTRLVVGLLVVIILAFAGLVGFLYLAESNYLYHELDGSLVLAKSLFERRYQASGRILAATAVETLHLAAVQTALTDDVWSPLEEVIPSMMRVPDVDSVQIWKGAVPVAVYGGKVQNLVGLQARLAAVQERDLEQGILQFEDNGTLWLFAFARTGPKVSPVAMVLIGLRLDTNGEWVNVMYAAADTRLRMRAGKAVVEEVFEGDSAREVSPPQSWDQATGSYALNTFHLTSGDQRAIWWNYRDESGAIQVLMYRPIWDESNFMTNVLTAVVGAGALLFSLAGLFLALNTRRILRPLSNLALAAVAMGRGEFDHPLQYDPHDQIGAIAGVFNEMREKVRQMVDMEKGIQSELERRVQQRTAERDELTERLQKAAEEERIAVEHEIHDGPVQDIAGLQVHLEMYEARWRRGEEQVTVADWSGMVEMASTTQRRLRESIADLRPPDLDRGLVQALEGWAQFRLAKSGVEIEVTGTDAPGEIPGLVARVMYRVGQECILNVGKHAEAKHLTLDYYRDEEQGTAQLAFTDDGKGFDYRSVLALEQEHNGHYGVADMRDWVCRLNGTLEVGPADGGGTQVIVTLPSERWAVEPVAVVDCE